MSELTITQFAGVAQDWQQKYRDSSDYGCFPDVERQVEGQIKEQGFLTTADLRCIAKWGHYRGKFARFEQANSEEAVRQATRRAQQAIDDPEKALECILALKHWGLSFGSKTLRFMRPADYGALDMHWLRERCLERLLPRIYDGKLSSMVRGYRCFLAICGEIRAHIMAPGPRQGAWFIADVEDSLFQFAREGGRLIRS